VNFKRTGEQTFKRFSGSEIQNLEGRDMKRIVFFLLAVCLLVGVTSGAASAKTLYLYATEPWSNGNNSAWEDALSANVKITQTNGQCMELRFSTEAGTAGTDTSPQIAFRALVDGVLARPAFRDAGLLDGAVYFDPSEFGQYDIASFNWFVCGLNIGVHTVQVQFLPVYANTATVRAGMIAIEFKSGKFAP